MHRLVLYEPEQDGLFSCVLEVSNGTDYVETDISARCPEAINAFCWCKTQAILAGQWLEYAQHTKQDALNDAFEQHAAKLARAFERVLSKK